MDLFLFLSLKGYLPSPPQERQTSKSSQQRHNSMRTRYKDGGLYYMGGKYGMGGNYQRFDNGGKKKKKDKNKGTKAS